MSIEENIDEIRRNIPKRVTVIAVSKTRAVEEMKTAYDMGIRDFGENKVQEFLEKYDGMPKDVRWHIIGHLQRNKVKYIAGKISLIHSLDSCRLVEELEKHHKAVNKAVDTLIQINIGSEETKTGLAVEELESVLEAVESCDFVKVKGLMAIIPIGDEDNCRMYFKTVREIWENLKSKIYKNISMEYLSLGMTNDYKIAVSEGSNMIRIGEGIFGKRLYNNIK